MKKRINSHLYTETKIVYKNNGLEYVYGENDTLFSNLVYPTKIKKEDLPKSFIKGRYYKNIGYADSANVLYLAYSPFYAFNHCFRDDALYVSYKLPIIKEKTKYGYDEYLNYDLRISGNFIIDFLVGVKENSNVDLSEIAKELLKKIDWFRTEYPNEPEGKHLDKIIKIIENF